MELKEIKKLKIGDFITFKYGDPPYFYAVTGKIISLSIPKKFKHKSAYEYDWKEKLALKGHVTFIADDGRKMSLCIAQIINGCALAANAKKQWKACIHSRIRNLSRESKRLQKLLK